MTKAPFVTVQSIAITQRGECSDNLVEESVAIAQRERSEINSKRAMRYQLKERVLKAYG